MPRFSSDRCRQNADTDTLPPGLGSLLLFTICHQMTPEWKEGESIIGFDGTKNWGDGTNWRGREGVIKYSFLRLAFLGTSQTVGRGKMLFFFFFCENRTGIWGVWNGWLLLYSFRGITCTHVAREGKAPLSSVSGGDLVRAEWHKISLRLWRNGHLPRTLKNLKDWLPQVLTESRHATGRYSLWVQCSEARNTKWRKFDPK